MKENSKNEEIRKPIPSSGYWTISDLAGYLEIGSVQCQQKLIGMGIKIISFGKHYRNKLVALEDLKGVKV